MSAVLTLIGALWLGHAAAGELPAEVDLNDLDRWVRAADQLLQGPSGCWLVQGQVVWAIRDDSQGLWDQHTHFSARFEAGRWDQPLGPFDPLVGQTVHPPTTEAVAVVDRWLESLVGPVETMVVSWDRELDAVVLSRTASLEDGGRDAEARTVFDPGGSPISLRVSFPRHKLGSRRRLVGAGYEVRTETRREVVLPSKELLVFRLVERGKVVRGQQEIWYTRWQPCS